MNTIYGLIDGDIMELRYVGQTSVPEQRRASHKDACSSNLHLNNWLCKTNWNMITLERDPVDLDEAEIRWIAQTREGGARLLNLADGGIGNNGPHTDETRARMRAAAKGRPPVSAETRARTSAAMMGTKNSFWGRRHTPKTRAILSAWAKAHPRGYGAPGFAKEHPPSAETRAKMSWSARHRRGRET